MTPIRPTRARCRACKIGSAKPPVDPETYVVEGIECRKLPLTHGQYALIYAADYERASTLNWSAKWAEATKSYYAARTEGSGSTKQTIYLHTWLKGRAVVMWDHTNGDTLDCRQINLREANRADNGRNRKLHSNNTSGYRGVSPHKPGVWKVLGSDGHGRTIYIGIRNSPEEGARLYDEWALREYGQFARLNFPLEKEAA